MPLISLTKWNYCLIISYMNKAKVQQHKESFPWQSLRIPFTKEERERFNRFIKETGRSAGPWVRVVILKELEREESSGEALRYPAEAMK